MDVNKKGSIKMKNRKGVLLTLLVLVIFILMLGEIITYVMINDTVSQASQTGTQIVNVANFVSVAKSNFDTCLYSLLSSSFSELAAYEASPAQRGTNFLNNTSSTLAILINNGTLFGRKVMQANLSICINSIKKEAAMHQLSLNISNASFLVYQSAPFSISAYYLASLYINSSFGNFAYALNSSATLPISMLPSLFGAENGQNYTLMGEPIPHSKVIVSGIQGSTSPYMAAYGRIFYAVGASSPTCSSFPSNVKSSSYILAVQNSIKINQNVCGFGALITNITNSSSPLKPYVVIPASSFSSIINGTYALVDGPALSVLNISSLVNAVNSTGAYACSHVPSYFDLSNGNANIQSAYGMFMLGFNRQVASFNGSTSVYIKTPVLNQLSNAQSASISVWVYLNSFMPNSIIFSDDWASPEVLQLYIHSNGRVEADFGNNNWIVAANTTPNAVKPRQWYNIIATWASGKGESIYINGIPQALSYIVGSATSTGSLSAGTTGDIAYNQGSGSFNGSIANMQVYNSMLSVYQVQQLYQSGINGHPISYSKNLVAWYPLNGNANDYSGNGNNGTAYSVLYHSLFNYPADPILQGSVKQFAAQPVYGFGCNNFQCNFSSLYLGNETLGSGKVAQFNGKPGSYITLPASTLLTRNGTFAAWVSANAVQNANAIIAELGTSATTVSLSFVGNKNNAAGGHAAIYISGSGSGTIELLSPLAYNNNTWIFIAGTYNSTGCNLYINGNKVNSTTSNCMLASSASGGSIGQYVNGGAHSFNGSIANVQIYSKALSPYQIYALYSEGISGKPIQQRGLMEWYPLNNDTLDYGPYSKNGRAYNISFANNSNVQSSALQEFGIQKAAFPHYAVFNGSAYISFGNSAALSPEAGSNGQMTLCLWYYINSLANYHGPLIKGESAPSSGNAWEYTFDQNGGAQGFTLWTGGGSNIAYASTGATAAPKTWYFSCFTYNYASSSAYYYLDGVPYSATFTSGTPATQGTGKLIIGAGENGYSNVSIADVQLYNVALSAQQIWQLYTNNSVNGIMPVAYWPLSSASNFNTTDDIVGNNTGYLYNANGICTVAQVAQGKCGVTFH